MEEREQRDVMMLVAVCQLTGHPVTPWDAHAALLRARELAEGYSTTDHPERTRKYIANDPLIPRKNV